MDIREQIRQMERINLNDIDHVPEWARAEQMERIIPLKELWKYPKTPADILKRLGYDSSELEKLRDGEDWSAIYDREERVSVLTELRQELSERTPVSDTDQTMDTVVHLTDILLQNHAMEKAYEENYADASGIRDHYMADNTMWILSQEEKRGNDRIFISGHNGHLEQSSIPAESSLSEMVNGYKFMGSIGENPVDGLNGIVYRFIPYAYRVWRAPSELYDGMIFVTEAHPISVNN